MASRSNKPAIVIIRNAAATDFGGAETYPVSLACLLSKEGTYHPVVVTSSQKLLQHAKTNGVEVKKGIWLPFQNWTGWRTALIPIFILWLCFLTVWYVSLIRKLRPQALHIQSRDDFIAASLAGHLTKTRVVWTDHMDLRYILLNTKKPFRNIAGKAVLWATRFADHIIIISDNERQLISELLPRPDFLNGKIRLIKNGVIDQLEATKATSPRPSGFRFCLASRLVVNKGIGDAIAAYKLLLESLPNSEAGSVYLDIYGSGADEATFKEQAKDLPGAHFYGHTDTPLAAMYESTVFMLPSYQEGFSIALLEATMLGKAIIASAVDSNPEIITNQKTGLLVPAHDSDALSGAMRLLYKNQQLLTSLEKGARKNFEKHYNLETIVLNRVMPLYEK